MLMIFADGCKGWYGMWSHYLGYAPGKYDWILVGIEPTTIN